MSEQEEGVAGVGLFVAAFVDERRADDALKNMKEAKKSGDFFFDDAAVVRSDDKGKIHITETGDMKAGTGAGIGALVGGVLAVISGPVGLAVGLLGGAAAGGLAVLKDSGFNDESLKELGSALVPGSSAIVATTSKKFVEEVRKAAEEGETLSIAKNISEDIRANLEARQDVLYTMVLTEAGVGAAKVVSSPSMLAVFGIAATEEGVVAGAAVATEEGVAYEVAAADEEGAALEAGVITDEGGVILDASVSEADEDE